MKTSNERIAELESKIKDLKESIGCLEVQLEAEREAAQHEAINRLENYINAVDTKFSSFREFWHALMAEHHKK